MASDPTPDRWRRVRDVFDTVADLPVHDRSGALDEACRAPTGESDDGLRADVQALLDADTRGSLLDGTAADIGAALVDDAHETEAEGVRFGAWRVVAEIGRGGMGAVYLVERADGAYDQRAALKRLSLTGPGRARRFERERQILAGLDHPGIARLLDGGVAVREDGDRVPYLVMEYVGGAPITRYADEHGLGVGARVRLFVQVCDAVGHAHRHLVVHRDLKPSNVLVAETDGAPLVKLLDFGIAKLLQEGDGDALTRTGLPVLTPEYAAPEQVTGEPVTTATDVYALGVLLYELLAGQRPYDIGPGTLAGIVEAVRDTEPRPASAVAPDRQRELRGDLDTIVAKALDKDPARRYGSAAALADDLRRHLDGRTVQARAPTAAYRLSRFVRRHRLGVAAAALVALAVAVGIAATLWQARQTRIAAAESEAAVLFLSDLLSAADPYEAERRDTLRVAALLDEGARRVREDLGDQPRVQARLLAVLGATYRSVERWEESEPLLRRALALHRRLELPLAARIPLLCDLSQTQSARAEHAEAVALAEQALELAHAERDPARLMLAEATLGRARLRAPSSAGADSLLRMARNRALVLYGDANLTVADLERDLGEVALDAGQMDRAVDHIHRAIDIGTRAAGAEHPLLIGYAQSLSFAFLLDGQTVAAEGAGARAVALARSVTPGSNRLGQALTTHAQALRRLGRLDEAEAELREAVPLFTRREADRATPLGTLASVLEEKGDLGAAIATQGESYRLLQDLSPPKPVAVSSAIKLARLLNDAGRYAAAEAVLGEAETLRDGLQAPPARLAAMLDQQIAQAYVVLYDAWGRPADAAPYRERAGSGAPAAHGVGHGS